METKKTFKVFTVIDYEKEGEYLRQMHISGWKLIEVSGFCVYHFERCVPEDVVYQLDYNKDGIAHKDEYVKMFTDCDWEYLQDYVGYSYFRKAASQTTGVEEIFCDDESRLNMLRRVFIGRIIPLIVFFSLVFIPQMICHFVDKNYSVSAVIALFICIYVWIFIKYVIKYHEYKRRR